jgi:hypothetical protein
MSNGRCRPGLLAVARTHGRCSPAVRLPGIGARFFTRLSQLSSQAADQNASVLRDFDCAQWCSPARSRSRKVHQPLLRGGIGRARALREGGVRSRRRGPAASCFARPAPKGKGSSASLRSSRASTTGPVSACSLMPSQDWRASLFGRPLGSNWRHPACPFPVEAFLARADLGISNFITASTDAKLNYTRVTWKTG